MTSTRLRRRMRTYRRYYMPDRPAIRPAFLVSTFRTGSNLLLSYLGSLSGITVRGEVLNPEAPEGLRRYLVTRGGVIRHMNRSLHGVRRQPGVEVLVSV